MLAGKGDLLPVSAFPGGRHVADGHGEMGEAEPRARDPGLGREGLHPVQPVRAGVSARRDPRQGLRRERARRRAGDIQVDAVQGQRVQGAALHDSGRARGLHRLQPLRQRLPGQGPHQPEAQGDRHAPAGAAAGAGARELRLLPQPAGNRPHEDLRSSITRARSSSSRCSSIRARARAAAKRRTSSCSPSCSATGCSSRTPPGARRSTAATCRRRRTRPIATGEGRRGRTRCSRTTPSSASASGWRSTVTSAPRAALVQHLAPQIGERLATAILDADQSNEAGIAAQRERVVALRRQLAGLTIAGGPPARDPGRLPREEERVARRRGRLGLRHRLRRPRPRPGQPARRQHPRHGHRGLLEHRRPGVESDAARRRRQVRRRRQDRSARRISACWPTCTGTSTSRRSRSAPRWRRRPRRSSRPSRTAGRR